MFAISNPLFKFGYSIIKIKKQQNMKKLFTTLTLLAGLAVGAYAQHCAADSTLIPIHPSSTPGLAPTSDQLPCTVTGTMVTDTIYFHNYHAFQGQNVQYIKVDSIGNLPAGLCWVSNKKSNSFAQDEDGVIYVSGTCTAAPGQYKLKIFIEGQAGVIMLPPNTSAEAVAGLRYWVRIKATANSCCTVLDTVNRGTPVTPNYPDFIPAASLTCLTGIADIANDVNNVSIKPNPFNSNATLSFNADKESAYTVKLTNLIGEVVMTKPVNAVIGTNNVTISKGNMPSGVYLLSLTNETGAITRKVIMD